MARNLVVARVGENSLHRAWLQNATPNFDTVLLFYGKNIPQAWVEDGLETIISQGRNGRALPSS